MSSNNRSSSGASGSSMRNSYKYMRNKKLIDEVKEVIQNRTDQDISKVLEYFDNDVGKAIDAFVNDNGKEALAKWSEMKNNKKSNRMPYNNENQSNTNGNHNNSNSKNNNYKLLNKKPNKNYENKTNKQTVNNRINDLVASIIDQHTRSAPTISSPPLTISSTVQAASSDANNSVTNQVTDDLKRFTLNSSSLVTSTNGNLKLNIIGLTQPTNDYAVSTVTQKELETSPPKFDTAVNNPNGKAILEKSQKDLQRQLSTLAKMESLFNEEITRSQASLNQTFARLFQLLQQRQAQLVSQFNVACANGKLVLKNRQSKAADLQVKVDNAIHLSDNESNELKADIKNFLSDRQQDEEFGRIKLFNENHNFDTLYESISQFGIINSIQDTYANQSSKVTTSIGLTLTSSDNVNEINKNKNRNETSPLKLNGDSIGRNDANKSNAASKTTANRIQLNNSKPITNGVNHTNSANRNKNVDSNNNNHNKSQINNSHSNTNNNSNHKNHEQITASGSNVNYQNGDSEQIDNEGDFIEVKKFRHRNKQPAIVKVNGTSNHHNHLNGTKQMNGIKS